MGDFDAKVKTKNDVLKATAHFRMGSRSRRGCQLLKFAEGNRLSQEDIFPKRDTKIYLEKKRN